MIRSTCWFGWVDSNNGSFTSWGIRGASLGIVLADATKMGTFAAGNGYKPTVRVEQVCADCNGEGKTTKKWKTKPCKFCRGNPILSKLEFPFLVHSNTTVHN